VVVPVKLPVIFVAPSVVDPVAVKGPTTFVVVKVLVPETDRLPVRAREMAFRACVYRVFTYAKFHQFVVAPRLDTPLCVTASTKGTEFPVVTTLPKLVMVGIPYIMT